MLEAPSPFRTATLRAFPAASLENLLRVLLVIAFIHALGVLAVGINQPLLDWFYFRQTQTALTTYWLLKGGPWFAYETPVLGAPWSVPLEFPVYQLITAAVAAIGVPLDAAGRLVAFGFFLGVLWPLRILFDELKLGRVSYLATAILFLACPLYLYWGRTFLVETCALFFAVLWLALLVRYLNRRDWIAFAGALAAGCLAILAKSTTLPAFTVLGCANAAVMLGREWIASERKASLVGFVSVAAMVGLPYLVGLVWTAYSDEIKSANEIGRLMTTRAMWGWFFGSLQQRLSANLWFDTVLARVIPDTLGAFSLLGLVVLGATLSRRTLIAATGALVGFVVPFLVFTNVHVVHSYYQAANAIFLVAAVGLGIGCIYDSGQRAVGLLLVAVIAASQLYFFYNHFFPVLTADNSKYRLLRVAQMARDATQPGQSLIVIGDLWESAVPYYAERKGLVLDTWFPVQRVLANPQKYLGDAPLGGVVYCIDKLPTYGASIPAIQAFIANRAVVGEFGGCQLLVDRSNFHKFDPIDHNSSARPISVAERCDGYIDSVNGASPGPSGITASGVLEVDGWLAKSVEQDALPHSVLVVLTDGNGTSTFIKTRQEPRPDVAEYFKRPALAASGYTSLVDLNVTRLDGKYTLGLAFTEGQRIERCPEVKIPVTLKKTRS